ncbi:MAG: hypothetical protein LWW90_08450, partial [Candidatus Desulfofervidus auxilii]|nr:hypothetical protein [Candidatus Desulfofervidus auxilii]
MKRFKIIVTTILIFLYAKTSLSQSIIIIPYKYLPSYFIAVDKSKQRLLLIEYNGTINIKAQIPCSTGSSNGDKFFQGDEKTPEGVYFISR